MDTPTIPFNRPSMVGNELKYIEDAIARRQLSGDGHYTALCNEWITAKTNCAASLLTHSCTAALEMSVILAEIEPGDEVIMPSFTFVSTANAVVLRGGIPVFVDIRPDTLNIDEKLVEAAVTEKTKAILAVHYAGVCAELSALREIASRHGLRLIEDAAQALGSTYKGEEAGSIGDMAAVSFHETKNITCGEGGAILINDPSLVERAEIIREKGTNRRKFFRGQVDKYSWVDLGSSFLPGELNAAFLYGQLEKIDEVTAARLAIWDRYHSAMLQFATAGDVQLPHVPQHCTHNGHMYYLILPNSEVRERFITAMGAASIITPFHYVPLHSAPAGVRFSRPEGDLEITNDLSSRLVRLPMFFSLGDKVDAVIDAAARFLKSM